MRLSLSRGVLGLLALTTSLVSAAAFTPPQVFKNSNLLRTIDLSRPYVKETTAVIVENVSEKPQTEYYVPFAKDVVPKISSIEARDKKGDLGDFEVKLVESNDSPTAYYRILFTKPLKPSQSYTLQIVAILTSTLSPLPKEIAQDDSQYLQYTGPRYTLSAYPTDKQKTKFRFPSVEIASFTQFPNLPDGTVDPQKTGNSLSYGPYSAPISEEKENTIVLRYDYTNPIIHVNRLERDIEVSHWGGNLATEERYVMTNAGAKLKDNFSRQMWTAKSYYNHPTAALKQLTYPLHPGTSDVYYTDEIGNVTTSRFRSNLREAHLELKPRFPLMGGWNYTFTVGWNNDLGKYLKQKVAGGEDYVLKVPFMQGPTEYITYEDFELRVILPEGATNVAISHPEGIAVEESRYRHQTYMDTIGRPSIVLHSKNLVDDIARGKEIIVTYTYPKTAPLRKPLIVSAGVGALFMASFLLGQIDVRIGK